MFDFILGGAICGSVVYFARPWVDATAKKVWAWVKTLNTKSGDDPAP